MLLLLLFQVWLPCSLERNNIGDIGIGHLIDGLQENKHLKTLMLGDNDIGNQGVAQFAEYLRKHESIREFS